MLPSSYRKSTLLRVSRLLSEAEQQADVMWGDGISPERVAEIDANTRVHGQSMLPE
jgi:hypothetical protein